LVVDDAVVMRKIITEALSRDTDIEVVGVAANGQIGLQKVAQLNPDIVTLDVEMPDMDGLTMLREVRKTRPKLPIIMFSTLTSRGAETTLDALAGGATDYVTKPSNVGNVGECIERLQSELIAKIKVHCRHLRACAAKAVPQFVQTPNRLAPLVPRAAFPHVEIVCLATSTGGPNALAEVFKNFPTDFPVPIVIVQHMPPLFTAMLADRLSAHSPVKFCEGAEGQVLEPGHGYIAPGGKHMEVRRVADKGILHLHEGPPENSCRPAADVLFRSVAAAYGGNVLSIVLTGMGQDGFRGCELIHEKHGQIVVQDEASSVVWGMPGYIANAGLADKVVPLSNIALEITRRVQAKPRFAYQ
jgi:two-component system chemotaxis response regulator CheB